MPNLGPAVSDPALLAQLNGQPAAGPSLGPAVTDPDLLKQLNTSSGTAPVAKDTLDNIADVGKGAFKSVASTVQGLAGLPGDAERGADWIFNKILPNPYNAPAPSHGLPSTADIDKYVPVSKLPDAETPIGKHVQSILDVALPGMIGGPENFVKNAITRGLVPGLASDAAGTATEGTAAEPWMRMAGSLFSPGGGAVKKVLPSTEDLLTAGGQGFDAFRQMPFAVKPQTMDTWATSTLNDLKARNFDADTAPATVAALSKHVGSTAPFVTAQDMDKTKMLLRDAQASGGNDATAATAALKSLDDRITSFTPNQTVIGDPALAAKTWTDANGNYAAGMRSQAVDDMLEKAKLQAFSQNSGAGIGNKLRGAVTGFVTNPNKLQGFTAAEEQVMKNLSKGSFAQNFMRAASNKLGGGGGLGQTGIMSLGGELGALGSEDAGTGLTPGALGGAAAAFLAGKLSRHIYNSSTNKAAAQISDLIRSRSPLGAAVPNPVNPIVPAPIARLLAAHAAMQQAQQPQ